MNKRGIETRKLIKEKAYYLFAEKGYKDVTMKNICEAAGLSRGGLYGHYESTKQIFEEIIEDMMGSQDEEFEAKIELGLPAVKILDEVLSRYINEMLDSRRSLSVAIYEFFSAEEISGTPNALSEQYLRSFDMWSKLIQYGINKQEFKNVNIAAVFDLIIFSYQGVRMYSKLMPVAKEIPVRIVQEIKKILVKEES